MHVVCLCVRDEEPTIDIDAWNCVVIFFFSNCEFLVHGQEQELPTFFSAEQQKNEQIVEVPSLCENMNTQFLVLANLLSSIVVGASKNSSISRNLNKNRRQVLFHFVLVFFFVVYYFISL